MHLPGIPSLVFLAFVLIVWPLLAIRSGRRFRSHNKNPTLESKQGREAIWVSTIVMQSLMFAFAWLVARGFDFEIFAVPAVRPGHLAAAAIALAGLLVLRALSRAVRTDEERRSLVVYYLAPRTGREWQLKTVVVLIASISEEAVYRGVAFQILWYSLGSALVSALICSAAFALAHWIQAWKSMLVIFGIAFVMHGLVYFTDTLVLAMIVHAIYDFIAIYLIWKESLRLGLNH